MYRNFLPAWVLFALGLIACHSEKRVHTEHGTLLVTNPLRKDIELTREYVAQIHAIQHIELRALERGYLRGIYVDEGQLVHEGRRMFQIMPLIYQAEVHKADSEAELAHIKYNNTKLLADQNVVSPNELALSRAEYASKQAQLALAETHLGLTQIRAPFTGIMGRFRVRLGSLVEEGELLSTLSDNRTVWVYFNVAEAEYLQYKSVAHHDKAQAVTLMMANGHVFDQAGKIETIEADFNNETGNIAFRAAFLNPNGLLRHGETGKILMTVPMPKALMIPQLATYEQLDRKFVYVLNDKGIVRSRAITVQAEMPHIFIVASGLSEGDKILVDGIKKVRDGDQIEMRYETPQKVLDNLELPSQ